MKKLVDWLPFILIALCNRYAWYDFRFALSMMLIIIAFIARDFVNE